ncbi:Protein kinase superfamily protein [Raphanus sativus]|nr:Protein kinase superfamily protein [Raphanus sativus]
MIFFCCFRKDDLVEAADYGDQNMTKQSGGDDGKRTAQNSAQDVKVQPIEVAALLADDISQATNDFKPRFLVGEGSYAKVYRGVLMNDQPVAIKKLEYNEQPDREFLAQVSIVSRLKHENFVELLGYSVDGNSRILVFEFAQNGSLHDILHGTMEK